MLCIHFIIRTRAYLFTLLLYTVGTMFNIFVFVFVFASCRKMEDLCLTSLQAPGGHRRVRCLPTRRRLSSSSSSSNTSNRACRDTISSSSNSSGRARRSPSCYRVTSGRCPASARRSSGRLRRWRMTTIRARRPLWR